LIVEALRRASAAFVAKLAIAATDEQQSGMAAVLAHAAGCRECEELVPAALEMAQHQPVAMLAARVFRLGWAAAGGSPTPDEFETAPPGAVIH